MFFLGKDEKNRVSRKTKCPSLSCKLTTVIVLSVHCYSVVSSLLLSGLTALLDDCIAKSVAFGGPLFGWSGASICRLGFYLLSCVIIEHRIYMLVHISVRPLSGWFGGL